MKNLIVVLLTLVLVVLTSAYLYAASDEKSGTMEGNKVSDQASPETMHDLNLTEEQETKIADIRKESKPKIEEAAKELHGIVKEEVEKIHGVLTEEQREKLRAMKDLRKERRVGGLAAKIAHLEELELTDAEMNQIAEIRKEFRPKIMQSLEGFNGVLTDEQKKAREEALTAGKNRREVWAAINLTDEQKQKVANICKEVRSVVREEMEKIRNVLSEEQQQKLTEMREERRERIRDRVAAAIANYKDLNLTDEQRSSIKEIRKEFRPKVHEAGNKLRAAIREELSQILGVIQG